MKYTLFIIKDMQIKLVQTHMEVEMTRRTMVWKIMTIKIVFHALCFNLKGELREVFIV